MVVGGGGGGDNRQIPSSHFGCIYSPVTTHYCILRTPSVALFADKTVCEEVRSILSPLPFSAARPGCSSGASSGGLSAMLDRRPKRKGKSKLAAEKYSCSAETPSRGRKPAQTFQKKVVIVDYMGPRAPRNFALKEAHVWMRGILPEIAITATEEQVRCCISDTLRSYDESLGADTFQFLEATGKCLCVPAQQASLEWTGRAVKQLAGAGAVYIRLLEEREEQHSSSEELSSSDSLPDVKITKRENSSEWYLRVPSI